jgi:hypothetical protein
MPITRTTISFTHKDVELLENAAKPQGASRSRPRSRADGARIASDKNPYPMRDLAEHLRATGDQGVRAGGERVQGRRGRG